jgi:hypothetical protein
VSICTVLSTLGRDAEAVEQGRQATVLLRESGSKHLLAHGLTYVGEAYLRAELVEEASINFAKALRLWGILENNWAEIRGVGALAKAECLAGRTESARDLLLRAAETLTRLAYLPTRERDEDDRGTAGRNGPVMSGGRSASFPASWMADPGRSARASRGRRGLRRR